MDPSVAEITRSAVGVLAVVISWAAIITIFIIFRNFIIAGISRAFIQAFESGNDKTRETLVRFLLDKNMVVPEIYASLKKQFEDDGNQGGMQ